MDSGDLDYVASEGNNNSINKLAIGHLCDILGKDLVAFYSCHKNLHEAELKSNRLFSLVDEISGRHNIESVE